MGNADKEALRRAEAAAGKEPAEAGSGERFAVELPGGVIEYANSREEAAKLRQEYDAS